MCLESLEIEPKVQSERLVFPVQFSKHPKYVIKMNIHLNTIIYLYFRSISCSLTSGLLETISKGFFFNCLDSQKPGIRLQWR